MASDMIQRAQRFPILLALLVAMAATRSVAQTNQWVKLAPTPGTRYDPHSLVDCSETKAGMVGPWPRYFSGSVYGEGKIYYWGGSHYAYPGNDMDVYDIATNKWTNDAELGIPSQCLAPCICNHYTPTPATGPGTPTPTPRIPDNQCDNYPYACNTGGPEPYNPSCLWGSGAYQAGRESKSVFRCAGGANDTLRCSFDGDCPGGSCSVGIPPLRTAYTPGPTCTDCRPMTEHTYQKGAFNPQRHKPTWVLAQGIWEFDPSSRVWSWLAPPPPNGADLSGRTTFWDSINAVIGNYSCTGGSPGVYWFNYSTNAWTFHDTYTPLSGVSCNNAFNTWDVGVQKFVMHFGDSAHRGQLRWFTYDPSKMGAAAWNEITANVPQALKGPGGNCTQDLPHDTAGYNPTDYCFIDAIAYDESNQRIITLTMMRPDLVTPLTLVGWSYNTATNTWTQVVTANAGGVGALTGSFNTFHYDPGTKSLYLLNNTGGWFAGYFDQYCGGSASVGSGMIGTQKITLDLGNPLATFTPANTATITPTRAVTPTTGSIGTPTQTSAVILAATITPTAASASTPTPTCGVGTTWQVGPSRTYKRPCDVQSLVHACDRVEVDAATYVSDVSCRGALWTADRLTIVGVGGRPVLDARGFSVQDKAIWVIGDGAGNGNGITVDNFEFRCETRINNNPYCSALVGDSYGSGIRIQGANLTVRNSYFHDNDNGILGGTGNGDILLENNEFFRNGEGSGQTHNVYIGQANSLTFRYNYSHDANVGHLLKSRAYTNYVLANRLMDMAGTASMEIDLPWGGLSYIIGNLLEKGPGAVNSAKLVTYDAEASTNPGGYTQELYAINNTAVSDCGTGCGTGSSAYLFYVTGTTSVKAWNNLWVDGGTFLTGGGTTDLSHNLSTSTPGLVNRAGFDYHLTSGSPAVNAGADPGVDGHGYTLLPTSQYVYDEASQLRSTFGAAPDVGAFEYTAPSGTPTVPPSAQRPSPPELL